MRRQGIAGGHEKSSVYSILYAEDDRRLRADVWLNLGDPKQPADSVRTYKRPAAEEPWMFVRAKEASCKCAMQRKEETLVDPGTSFSTSQHACLSKRPLMHVTDRDPNNFKELERAILHPVQYMGHEQRQSAVHTWLSHNTEPASP